MSFAESYVGKLDKEGITSRSEIMPWGEGREAVEFGMRTDTMKAKILAIFDTRTVAVRCFGIAKVPDNKYGDVLMVCNELNNRFRFGKFLIDDDSEVALEADEILDEDTAGEETYVLAIQSFNMVEEAYPQIMKALWG